MARNNIVPFVRLSPYSLPCDLPCERGFQQWVRMVDRILNVYVTTEECELRWVLSLSAIVRYADALNSDRDRAIALIQHWCRRTLYLLSKAGHGRLREVAREGVAIATQVFGLPSDSSCFE